MMNHVILALLALGISGFFVKYNIVEMQNSKRLDESGVKVMSEPATQYTESKGDYRVTFIFKANGKTRRCFGSFNAGIIHKLKLSPVLEVTYLPDDLSVCRIEHEEVSIPPLWFAILSAICVLCALGYLYNLFTATRNN